jgi:trigger factor
MRNNKRVYILLVSAVLLAALISGCGTGNADNTPFHHSNNIDENGRWERIKALDYVEIFNYKALPIPSEVHQISEGEIQAEIDSILSDYAEVEQITDRPVADGDVVNIDYVGSVDGVEFDGGSTGGMGTDVTAGSTQYIDDFLFQIIGHMPGDTVNVEVTFPDNYHSEDLQGKDALFVTVINYIAGEEIKIELTDEFVAENLSGYGWNTINDMKDELRSDLKKMAVENYVTEYLSTKVSVKSVPDKLMEHQEYIMIDFYQQYADMYGLELDEFLSTYAGYANVDELVDANIDIVREKAAYYLVIQAVAEDAGITVSEADVANHYGDDYSEYEEHYGLPSLKQEVLQRKVLNYIIENAVLS